MSWAIPAKQGEGKFEKAPAGNHPAVLVAMIDLGNQWQEPYGTPRPGEKAQAAKYQHRLYFVYELVTKKLTGKHNENHLIAIDLTLSMHEKSTMRKWVEARLGRRIRDNETYDVSAELGQPVLLNVVEKNGYPKIAGVSGIPDGLPVPPAQRPATSWKLNDPFALLPSWLPWLYGRDIPTVIRDSEEYKAGAVREEGAAVAGNPVGQSAPQQAPPSSPPAAARPPIGRPRPASPIPPAGPPAPASVWQVWDEEGKDWGPLTAKEIQEWYQGGNILPESIRVYPDGWSATDAKSAREYGFPELIPF